MEKHSKQAFRHETARKIKTATLLAFIFLFGFNAMAQSDFVINSSNILTGYTGAGGDITIPDGVVGIGYGAFLNNKTITSVTIPASVQSIDEQAFSGCSLKTVAFAPGSQLTTIGNLAFSYSGLTSIMIPSSVQTINYEAFLACYSLNHIVFEEGSRLNRIGESSFNGTGLTAIDIPVSVQNIDDYAFSYNPHLTNVTVHWNDPSAVMLGGNNVFFGILANAILHVPDGLGSIYQNAPVWMNFYKIVETSFTVDGFLINSSNIVTGYVGSGGDITIPGGVVGIDYGAFLNNTTITSVTIPASVQSINDYAFSRCSLQTVAFAPESQLATIGANTFQYSGLTTITIPASVQTLGYEAFFACSSLNQVVFEEGSRLNRIGESSFNGTGLTAIDIPVSVQNIDDYAFSYNPHLTNVTVHWNDPSAVTLGNNVFLGIQVDATLHVPTGTESLYQSAPAWSSFYNRTTDDGFVISLSNILTGYVGAGGDITIPDGVVGIGTGAFLNNQTITSVTIPASVQSINDYAFSRCSLQTVAFVPESQLTTIGANTFQYSGLTTITIPTSVQTLGYEAFFACSSLNHIVFEEGSRLNRIGESSFNGTGLTAIDIPVSVQNIDDYAFSYNPHLTNVTVHWNDPSAVMLRGNNVFFGILANAILHVPDGLGSIYQNAPVWMNFYKIVETSFTVDGFLINSSNIVTGYVGSGGDITIPGGVVSIGYGAFQNNTTITSVTIPASVQSINDYAFSRCSLQTVAFAPESQLATIGNFAFSYSGLTSIMIPSSVQTINYVAFLGCYSLNRVVFEEGSLLNRIGESSFNGTGLTAIDIPVSVQNIDDYAFSYNPHLTNVTVHWNDPSAVMLGGNNVFFGIPANATLHVPAGTESLYQNAPVWMDFYKIVEQAFKNIELTPLDDLTVRIANTGDVATGELTIELSGADADVFTLSSATIDDLAAGAEADITLTPREGLVAGTTYTATLTVSGEGLESQSTGITYTATNTGIGNIAQVKPLNAWMQNGRLHVSGLTADTRWVVRNTLGEIVYQNVAGSDKASVQLSVYGVYFVQSGKQVVKVLFDAKNR